MKLGNIGDLAQSAQLRRDTVRVKTDLNRLTSELSSGKVASLTAHLKGQFGPLAGVSRSLTLTDANLASNGTATRMASAQQLALGAVQDVAKVAGPDFLDAASAGTDVQRETIARNALGQLEQVLSALNIQIEDKALFAGAALNGPALADAETILTDLESTLASAAGPADAIALVLGWFDAPSGGFETVAYRGAAAPMSDITIAPQESVRLDTTASHPALRDTLRGLALGALVDRGLFAGDSAAEREIMKHAGETLMSATDGVIALQAAVGFTEARIETARIRIEAEQTGLKMARAALVEADPYETALRLQEVQIQLETIYSVTARVSSLSLAQVLR